MQLGNPCWTNDGLAKVIGTTVAAMDTASVPYFLSAHSPFKYISDIRDTSSQIGEEDVFKEIFSPARSQVLCAIKGEPGTGKSHLVHWLKLRADYANATSEPGFNNMVRVLVQRRSGSLKDALQQIIEQLGSEFQHELKLVGSAIERLSATTARATLLNALVLELDHHWPERGRPPIPKRLKHLGLSLHTQGTQRWFLRDGGVIAQVIDRLTQNIAVEDRDTFPTFTEQEFAIPAAYKSANENVRAVFDLLADFEVDSDLLVKAVGILNIALKDSVRELTGLRGSSLQSVFSDIRKKLGPKKVLALFVEDVSVTGFDRDVINALEPQTRDGLCRMVSVIGITSNGWDILEAAQKQRVAPTYEIGAQMTKKWADDPMAVAEFTARYLNAVRLDPKEIDRLAKARFSQKDLSISKCTNCEVRTKCHELFGHVRIGEVDVGFFPFSARAPHALLSRLKVSLDGSGVARTQRGILNSVIRPLVETSSQTLQEGKFPATRAIPVEPTAKAYWDRFKSDYLGGARWDDKTRARLEFLGTYWIDAKDVPTMSEGLLPFLEPLGFPPFSRKVTQPSKPHIPEPGTRQPEPPPPQPAPNDSELDKKLAILKAWAGNNAPLARDSDFRILVGDLISNSIDWQDQRLVPISAFKHSVKGRNFPRFQDQPSRVAGQSVFFDINRSEESLTLMNALVRHSASPRGSWQYEGGQRDLRTVYRWIRKNRDAIIATVAPKSATAKDNAISAATQILYLAMLLRDRNKVAATDPDKLNAIFIPIWEEEHRPEQLSKEMEDVVSDLGRRVPRTRHLLIENAGLAQGRADPEGFIDPTPLLKAIATFEKDPAVKPIAPSSLVGPQKEAFSIVTSIGPLADMPKHAMAERKAIGELDAAILKTFKRWGLPLENVGKDLPKALKDLIALFDLQVGADSRRPALDFPSAKFERIWQQRDLHTKAAEWSECLKSSSTLSSTKSILDVLRYNAGQLRECSGTIEVIDEHLERLLELLDETEEDLKGRGGDLRNELIDSLHQLATVAEGILPKEGKS